MRKLLITIALCLPSLTVLADADKKPSSTWFRSSTDHYQYYSTGDKEYGIQASMRLVDNSKKAKAIANKGTRAKSTYHPPHGGFYVGMSSVIHTVPLCTP